MGTLETKHGGQIEEKENQKERKKEEGMKKKSLLIAYFLASYLAWVYFQVSLPGGWVVGHIIRYKKFNIFYGGVIGHIIGEKQLNICYGGCYLSAVMHEKSEFVFKKWKGGILKNRKSA